MRPEKHVDRERLINDTDEPFVAVNGSHHGGTELTVLNNKEITIIIQA